MTVPGRPEGGQVQQVLVRSFEPSPAQMGRRRGLQVFMKPCWRARTLT
jgi:hypothetical protein